MERDSELPPARRKTVRTSEESAIEAKTTTLEMRNSYGGFRGSQDKYRQDKRSQIRRVILKQGVDKREEKGRRCSPYLAAQEGNKNPYIIRRTQAYNTISDKTYDTTKNIYFRSNHEHPKSEHTKSRREEEDKQEGRNYRGGEFGQVPTTP